MYMRTTTGALAHGPVNVFGANEAPGLAGPVKYAKLYDEYALLIHFAYLFNWTTVGRASD